MIDRQRLLCYWQPSMNRFGSIILVALAVTVMLG